MSAAFTAIASLDGQPLDDLGIRDAELARSRHALAYLKERIGDERMRNLLTPDIEAMTQRVCAWVEASGGRWRTGITDLIVPGPSAAEFHHWYERAMTERCEAVLRAGHPEHFVLSPGDLGIEVIENIGETDLPWTAHCPPTRFRPSGTPPTPYGLVLKSSMVRACVSVIRCTKRAMLLMECTYICVCYCP